MMSTAKRGYIVTQSVDDIRKLSQMYVTPIQRTSSAVKTNIACVCLCSF